MAKGMRSKIKRRFRAIKRQTVFAPVETARTQRLAAKQTQTEQQTNSLNSQEQSLLQHKTEVFTFSPTTDLTSGSLCYTILGLIDPEIIDSTNIEGLMNVMSKVVKGN
ncbi:7803_t:CDS:1 [Rhizophagus irregularis]|uniref:DUF2423 domain-containing protein n=1 Tax=Rhizophagus irregularis (strain DAOM 197198w) TaxID=1432141 RepID=A0A015K3L5_RHIIW|nr:hypothetical protein RirG_165610 [Rhizophagus irregularis DAOM 197198w]CAG8550277.1 7803_t:CDS:1 [Rhizophagus irregularis]